MRGENISTKPTWLQDDLEVPEPTPNGIRKMVAIIRRRIRQQGWIITLTWLYVILMSKIFGYVPLSYSKITEQVFVGSQYRTLGKLRLRSVGVTATINLREEFDYSDKTWLFEDYVHIPVADETAVSIPQLQEGVHAIEQFIRDNKKVYVHCASGVGRSVMVVIAYLMTQGVTYKSAYATVKSVRPFIYLFPAQRSRLLEFEASLQSV